MSYSTIETAILTVLRTHADFDSTNCLAGDLGSLAKGKARAVNVKYGSHSEEEITIRTLKVTWTINIDVYTPWTGRLSSFLAAVHTEMQKVVDTLEKYPRLNDTSGVLDAKLGIGNSPDPATEQKGRYRSQRLVLTVQEAVTPTRLG